MSPFDKRMRTRSIEGSLYEADLASSAIFIVLKYNGVDVTNLEKFENATNGFRGFVSIKTMVYAGVIDRSITSQSVFLLINFQSEFTPPTLTIFALPAAGFGRIAVTFS
jgi:hypothetical protein